jgi:hypothetical protein
MRPNSLSLASRERRKASGPAEYLPLYFATISSGACKGPTRNTKDNPGGRLSQTLPDRTESVGEETYNAAQYKANTQRKAFPPPSRPPFDV